MRVLVVDDEAELVRMLVEHLRNKGAHADGETDPRAVLKRLKAGEVYDVLVSDVEMGEVRGLELMRAVHALRSEQLVVLMTAFGSMELAAQAMREGAADFIAKPFPLDVFSMVLERVLDARKMRREIVHLREAMTPSVGNLVAQSSSMRRVLKLAQRAAITDATILLLGESGVGKSVIARHIHDLSPRSKGPFVPLNAAALPDALVESELFGARRGAFTDAREDRDGVFQQARGGTLFLDEVAELSHSIQPKLLQALETRRVRPVGAPAEVEVDLRLIAATHQNLVEMVRKGEFREDLYYRLHIVPIVIPPLRERIEDIAPMAEHMVAKICARMGRPALGVSASAMRWLSSQAWPGNVRELANTLERALIMSEHDVLTLDDLHASPRTASPQQDDDARYLRALLEQRVSMQELEQRYIQEALSHTNHNKTETARLLQIDRKTLYRKLEDID